MLSESARQADFMKKMSPHLVGLMQFSLWLTKNGLDAARLMREAMTVTYRSKDQITEEEGYTLVHNFLTRRCLGRSSREISGHIGRGDPSSWSGDPGVQCPVAFTTDLSQQSRRQSESEKDVTYFEAFAGLPTNLRPVMILSYLEGFSNREIADLAGVQSHAVETLLKKGCDFLREEFFAYFMADDGDVVASRRIALSG